VQFILSTISQILTAGVAITAFSLLLYVLTFNLKDRVVRSFSIILLCIVVALSAEALGSTASGVWEITLWLRIQWMGIIVLPAAYLHFSDALLATTGKPSQWRRFWAVRVAYFISLVCLISLPYPWMLGPVVLNQAPAPHLQPTLLTELFIVYYLVVMAMAWFNFVRALRRTTTSTSRRRMVYLITSAIGPALGSFPYLLFGSDIAARHPLIFWSVAIFTNLVLGGLVVVMAYAVAFFGVSWTDRVVKSRLFKWLMRGPVTACFTLALTTLVRRAGEIFGFTYSALVPITMVITILTIEYLITLFAPFWEGILFFGNDREELNLLRKLQDRLLTRNDLHQFLEMILAAVCDRLQAPGGFVAAFNEDNMELIVSMGKTKFIEEKEFNDTISKLVQTDGSVVDIFHWGGDFLVPLTVSAEDGKPELLGLIGVSGVGAENLDQEQRSALRVLAKRAGMAMQDRKIQHEAFRSLETLTPQMEIIQGLRAAGQFEGGNALISEDPLPPKDMVQWVKEALVHYWGGPKLTKSPLLKLQIVQDQVVAHDGNYSNALRSILREAIDHNRPDGERRFTAEWVLYNILEMKFLEGKKVREIALRLAVSEADLYRKQRVAIDAVAKTIYEMEAQAQQHNGGG
jgi:hypothetical protein